MSARVHRIDDRDLRQALLRLVALVSADEVLEAVRIARIDRELDELREQEAKLIAKLDNPPPRTAAELLDRHDELDRLRARWDRLMSQRFPNHVVQGAKDTIARARRAAEAR